ncbi:polyprenyl diphosphate synthase [Piscinibacterium candidicorallinum]|uniref:Isoprenyl transferase n=1 Tax=Piscinibacterium candidicorallinum TaxID=1793872 RepID=A0ABV7GZF9_9BURK
MQSSTQTIPSSSDVPRHVAIIMDGNGRWAQRRMLPRFAGHARGVEAVRNVVKRCVERGVKYLTLFAFSSENWRRPPEEVGFLMRTFMAALEHEIARMERNGVRLRIAGDLSRFDPALRAKIEDAQRRTAGNSTLTLTVCANYGGRWEILEAIRQLLRDQPGLRADEITEDLVTARLVLRDLPEPDLFIRTGGERRISNFLLWQLAYTELYFTDRFWPDFDAQALDDAISSYAQRERRFGRTSEQVRHPGSIG